MNLHGARGSGLDRATAIASARVGSFGLIERQRLTCFGLPEDIGAFLNLPQIRDAVAQELADAMTPVRLPLADRRRGLRRIAGCLFGTGPVEGKEVAAILATPAGTTTAKRKVPR